MKHRLCRFCLLVLPVTLAAAAQAPPPVKMGLWKTSSVVTIGGFDLPSDASHAQSAGTAFSEPRTLRALVCVTPASWKQLFDPGQRDQRCQFTNQKQSSGGISADLACNSADRSRTSTGRMSMTLAGSEQMQGVLHMEVRSQAQPRPILMDNNFTGVYQGADCKGVSPDSPRLLP